MFFLMPLPVGDGSSAVLSQLSRAWPVLEGDVVQMDFGTMPLDDVLDEIASTPYKPDGPFGNPGNPSPMIDNTAAP